MKALCWHGKHDMRVDNVDDPKIEEPGDVIIKVTATAICGSDLHIYNGLVPTMKSGDVVGHEPMGKIVEVGGSVKKLKVGDRIVVPFTISCGSCYFCEKTLFSLCDNSNRNAEMAEKEMGHAPAGLLGFSHMLGGYAGGQAEYLRVPYADVGALKVNNNLPDEKMLFLSDIFPTGYMAAENANIQKGDTVAVWGCGPVGQFAMKSAWMFGAGRVIGIDSVTERLELAKNFAKAEIINYEDVNVLDQLNEITLGRGPDSCIDAVGAEAHINTVGDKIKNTAHKLMSKGSDSPQVLTEAIMSCRKGGTISVPGVYVGELSLPFGAAMNKALRFNMGQTHVPKYSPLLLEKITKGEIDPSAIITHSVTLAEAPKYYKTFDQKKEGCIKVVIKP